MDGLALTLGLVVVTLQLGTTSDSRNPGFGHSSLEQIHMCFHSLDVVMNEGIAVSGDRSEGIPAWPSRRTREAASF